jgi:hypothetical protein
MVQGPAGSCCFSGERGLSARYANFTATRSEVQFVTTKLQVEASTTFANFPYNIEPSKVHLDWHDAMSAVPLFSYGTRWLRFLKCLNVATGFRDAAVCSSKKYFTNYSAAAAFAVITILSHLKSGVRK